VGSHFTTVRKAIVKRMRMSTGEGIEKRGPLCTGVWECKLKEPWWEDGMEIPQNPGNGATIQPATHYWDERT
jgi:hypothetical protein